MSSAGGADATAAMAVDNPPDAPGELLGAEEEIDDTLANLLSASWPAPVVVDDRCSRYPWEPLGASLVEQRFADVDSRRMVSVWTTIRAMYGTLYAVPEGTATDFPFLRNKEDWRVCRVLGHLAVRELPPEVGNQPHYSWEYFPGTPPKMGEGDPGFFVPAAMGEWTVRSSQKLLALYGQREIRDIPVVRRKALYPTTPAWWASLEVPRGMAARIPQLVGLQGSQLMGETLGGPYNIMLATLWAVDVGYVFVGSIRHHGHLWRLPVALRAAFGVLTTERLCSADPTMQPLLEAGLVLLHLVEEKATRSYMEAEGSPRGVFRCSKSVNAEGVLTLLEGLGDPRLPYEKHVRHDLRIRTLNRELADSGPARYGPAAAVAAALAPSPPASSAVVAHSTPPVWGGVSRPPYATRGGMRNTRARGDYTPGGSGSAPLIGGRSGPPLGALPLFSWDGSAQLSAAQPVGPAVWSGLGRSLGDLPPIMNNGVDHTLIMALSRAYVRLRNEMVAVTSRPMGDRDADRLYSLGTVESLRRILAEEYGVAVSETNTVLAGWSIRRLGAAGSPGGSLSPATHKRPPSPSTPHFGAGSGSSTAPPYGAGSGSSAGPRYGPGAGSYIPSHYGAASGASAAPRYGAATGPSAHPPSPSGPGYYTPDAGPSQGDSPGYEPRSRGY